MLASCSGVEWQRAAQPRLPHALVLSGNVLPSHALYVVDRTYAGWDGTSIVSHARAAPAKATFKHSKCFPTLLPCRP
eukprot:277452-Chlamydomonas_euryale.AAC.1